jgi:hypothetical protein
VDRGNGKRSFSGGSFNAEKNAFYNISKNPEALFTTIGGSNQCWTLRGPEQPENAESGFLQVDKDIVDALSDSDVRKAIITKQAYSDYWIYGTSSGDTTWYNYRCGLHPMKSLPRKDVTWETLTLLTPTT